MPIYKYFSQQKFLENFIEQGEVYLNSLSYFIGCEDQSRRDETEDTNIYRPMDGLIITNYTKKTKSILEWQLNSQVNKPDCIFVFCVSTQICSSLFKKFNAFGCVEISNVEEFKVRLLKKSNVRFGRFRNDNEAFISGQVEYYNPAMEPGSRHACPDKIIMSKPERFSEEQEYRFVIASDSNLLAVDNVRYSLSADLNINVAEHKNLILRLGSLKDICRVVSV